MGLPFAELEWDERNEAHIARHGVTSREVYEAAFDPGAIFRRVRKSRAPRYLLLGATAGGRRLSIVLEKRASGAARIVTARDMDANEKRQYRRRGR